MTFVVVGMVFASLAAGDDPVVAEWAEEARRVRAAQVRTLVAWGELQDGAMAEGYAEVVRAADDCWHWQDTSVEELAGDPDVARLRASWSRRFEQVSAAAHARDTSYRWRQLRSLPSHAHLNAIEMELRLRLFEGRDLDAVRLWLDGTTMMVDASEFLGDGERCLAYVGTLFQMWSPDRLACIGEDAHACLRDGLEVMRVRLRRVPDVRLHIGDWAIVVEQATPVWSWSIRERVDAWRSLFRPEQMLHDRIRRAIQLEPVWSDIGADPNLRMSVFERARRDCPPMRHIDIFGGLYQHERMRRAALQVLLRFRELLQ